MVKTRLVASAARAGLTLGACLVGLVSVASAMTTSDRPASILMWPKIVVNEATDTIVDISNVSKTLAAVHCWMINANSHCASSSLRAGEPCTAASECPLDGLSGYAACVPGWSEIDFELYITPDQPLAWVASKGLRPCRSTDCDDRGLAEHEFPLNARGLCVSGGNPTGQACNPDVPSSANSCGGAGAKCVRAISNAGSAIPPVPEIPFIGAIKCVQYNPDTGVPEQGSAHNALIGHAAITSTGTVLGPKPPAPEPRPELPGEDVQRYNAVGLLHLNDRGYSGTLKMDGDMYAKCPATLVLDHPFEGAPLLERNTIIGNNAATDITLLPCGDDFLRQKPGQSVAQILVINEYEQRLSASKRVDCLYESLLSGIDSSNPNRSIFSYNVQGTMVGQTWIRGTGSAATGHGLVGVARSALGKYDTPPDGNLGFNGFYGSAAAYNLQQKADSSSSDFIIQP